MMFGRYTLAFFSHHLGTYIQEHSYYTTRNFQKSHSQECKESGNSLMALGGAGDGAAQHRETAGKKHIEAPYTGFYGRRTFGFAVFLGQVRHSGEITGRWVVFGRATVRYGTGRIGHMGTSSSSLQFFFTTLLPYLHQALDGEKFGCLLLSSFSWTTQVPIAVLCPPLFPIFFSQVAQIRNK